VNKQTNTASSRKYPSRQDNAAPITTPAAAAGNVRGRIASIHAFQLKLEFSVNVFLRTRTSRRFERLNKVFQRTFGTVCDKLFRGSITYNLF
jgi:hypothetical protein